MLFIPADCKVACLGYRQQRVVRDLTGAVQDGQRGPRARNSAEKSRCKHAAFVEQLEEQHGEPRTVEGDVSSSSMALDANSVHDSTLCGSWCEALEKDVPLAESR